MKFKKLLIAVLSVFLIAAFPQNVYAAQSQGPHPATWKVLVLVTPNVAASLWNEPTRTTTMHEPEITEVTQIAKSLENWSTNWVNIDVDVKVDYEAITSFGFDRKKGFAVTPSSVKNQIERNAPKGEYDSILVVYRDGDGTQSFGGCENTLPRLPWNPNDTTFATLGLNYSNHDIKQFDIANPEQLLMTPLLDSVYKEMSRTDASVKSPYDFINKENPAQNRRILMDYINSSEDGRLGANWKNFVAE